MFVTAPTPWEPDWPAAIEHRRLLLRTGGAVPPYLVQPEIEALLGGARHDTDRLMIELLWRTGARVSELLALTEASFVAAGDVTWAALTTLKRRGRPRKGRRDRDRLVPLAEAAFLERLQGYLVTHRPRGRLFGFTRQTVRNRLRRVAERSKPPFRPSPHTLRHSFAVNCLLHGVPTRILQIWLGHADPASTELYTQVLDQDTAHFMRAVAFTQPDRRGPSRAA